MSDRRRNSIMCHHVKRVQDDYFVAELPGPVGGGELVVLTLDVDHDHAVGTFKQIWDYQSRAFASTGWRYDTGMNAVI